MAQNKLQTARELIEDQHYAAARQMLESMPDDPTARKWLRQLNRRERLAMNPPGAEREAAPRLRTADASVPGWVVGLAIVVLVVVVAFFGYSLYSERQQWERSASEYACGLLYERYTPQWQNCVDDR